MYALPEEVLFRCHTNVAEFDRFEEESIDVWNKHIKKLSESEIVINAIEKFCYYTPNEQIFRNVLVSLLIQILLTYELFLLYINTPSRHLPSRGVGREQSMQLVKILTYLFSFLYIQMSHICMTNFGTLYSALFSEHH